MKILLHIGQSKTGTSAIQAFLTLNRSALKAAGVLYPATRVSGMSLDMGAHNAVADSLMGLSRFPYVDAGQYFDQFFSEAAQIDAKLMILSAEHFFGGEPRIWDVGSADEYFDLYRQKLEKLSHYLAGHEVNILVYLRPQSDWLASAVGQTVRIDRLISDFPIYQNDRQFYELMKPLLQYSRIMSMWRDTIRPAAIEVVPYIRDRLHNRSSISDFIHRAGLENIHFPYANVDVQVNTSFTREYLEVKKSINTSRRGKNSERVIIRLLEQLSAASRESTDYQLDEDVERDLQQFVASENAALNAQFGNGAEPFVARSKPQQAIAKLSHEVVSAAMERFSKEYRSVPSKVLWLNFATKGFLRRHCRPVHAFLHQFKMAYIKHKYKN